jgi:hypothetical protein
MAKKFFIDEEVNILTDKEAEAALKRENDQAFLSATEGVTKVSVERWQKAQYAERKHWMQLGRSVANDRNDDHSQHFDHYSALQGVKLSSVIEMGCGPFTNLRLIATKCTVEKCTLLDPLIESYLKHANCTYTRQWLFLTNIENFPTKIGRQLTKLVRQVVKQFKIGRKLPITQLIATPIETMPTDSHYDLTILINVIEHCYDIQTVFDNILKVTDRYIIFHDKYYDHATVAETVQIQYDAAHPLRVDRKVIDTFLEEHFTPLYRVINDQIGIVEDIETTWQAIYYIGERKSAK